MECPRRVYEKVEAEGKGTGSDVFEVPVPCLGSRRTWGQAHRCAPSQSLFPPSPFPFSYTLAARPTRVFPRES
jgi:hypothetical protein